MLLAAVQVGCFKPSVKAPLTTQSARVCICGVACLHAVRHVFVHPIVLWCCLPLQHKDSVQVQPDGCCVRVAWVILGYLVHAWVILGYLVHAWVILGYLVHAWVILGYLVHAWVILGYLVHAWVILGYLVHACCTGHTVQHLVCVCARVRACCMGQAELCALSDSTNTKHHR